MSIYVTGDIHASHDIQKLNTTLFPEQKKLTRNDYVIILGDFGLTWDDSEETKYWLKWLEDKTFTTLFIDGNHENFDRLYQYPIVEYLGGKTHKLSDSIYHLMRGEIFTIEGLKFFAFGGGISIDKVYRRPHISWWEQEIPNYTEIENGFANLEKVENTVDIVLTHAAPSDISMQVLGHHCEVDEVTKILDAFKCKIYCKKWYFGHHHTDQTVNDKFTVMYNKIIKVS